MVCWPMLTWSSDANVNWAVMFLHIKSGVELATLMVSSEVSKAVAVAARAWAQATPRGNSSLFVTSFHVNRQQIDEWYSHI